jgi:dipeptidyl aminopeptidase/acylaminoacyl peptidase
MNHLAPSLSVLLLACSAIVLATGELHAQSLPSPTAAGKESGLIPRRILFGNPDKASPQISPDGKRLSFLAPVKGVLNVWVGPVDDPAAAKPVTNDTKRGIRSYSWAFTNRHILYVQDANGDENYHLYRVDLSKNETTDLTPLEHIRAEIEETSHRFPDELVVRINDRNPQFHSLYKINLLSGERTLLEENTQFAGYVLDEDLKVRFALRYTPDGGSAVLEKDEGKWKEFTKIPQEDTLTTSPLGFDKTGTVLYLRDSRGRNTGVFKSLNLATREEKIIAEDHRSDAGSVLAHPTENTVQAVSFTYERTQWKFLDKAVQADFEKIKKLGDGDVAVGSRTLDDRKWIVGLLVDNGPLRYYLYDRDSGSAKFLFTNRQELEGWPLQKMNSRVLKSRDGMNLVSYLTLPPGADPDGRGKPKQPVPMVLLVHGGPWGRDSWGLNGLHQFLANRGYAVLSVNYRGSTGFGKDFLNAGNREWAAKMHDDLLDAVDWAIAEKIADPRKIGIMGGSYGGYATLVGLTFTPEKFACGVDIVGPSNLVTLLSTIPPYWAPMVEMFKIRVGDVSSDEGKKFLASRSPLSKAEQIRRPLLIAQGANDPRVKQAEADQIVGAMKEKKLPVTYVLFPDEGHGFARPPNSLAFNAVAEAFLARFLGGRYEEIGDAFEGSSVEVPTGAEDVPGLAAKLPVAAGK